MFTCNISNRSFKFSNMDSEQGSVRLVSLSHKREQNYLQSSTSCIGFLSNTGSSIQNQPLDFFLYGTAPIHLQELIHQYKPSRNPRSSSQSRLTSTVPSTKYGRRSFSVQCCWTLEQFNSSWSIQKCLKTHLFNLTF